MIKAYFYALIAIPLIVLSALFFDIRNASAATGDFPLIVDDPFIRGGTCSPIDISHTFIDLINDSSNVSPEFKSLFNIAVDQNNYGAFIDRFSANQYIARILFRPNILNNLYLSYQESTIYNSAYYSITDIDGNDFPYYRISIGQNATTCEPYVSVQNENHETVFYFTGYDTPNARLRYTFWFYAGEFLLSPDLQDQDTSGIPATLPSEPAMAVNDELKPEFFIIQSQDFNVQIRDKNFMTSDYSKYTCDNGERPITRYSYFEGKTQTAGGQWLGENTYDPISQLEIQFPKTAGDYSMVALYSCNGNFNDFSQYAYFDFYLNDTGQAVQDLFNDCILDEAPFFDVPKCLDNIKILLNLLSFDTVKFNSSFQSATPNNSSCRTMQVLDDWIHKPGITLCPLFPEYVRNIVTPFVTLLLGLIMIRFISGKTGGGFS